MLMPFLYRVNLRDSAVEGWKIGRAPLTVGRDEPALVRVADECLSREHFMISREPRGYVLRDLGSKNGTWLNGERVLCAELPSNARIHAGKSVFLFEPGLQTMVNLGPAKEHVRGAHRPRPKRKHGS